MEDWMQQRLVEAQAIGWKIACVRAIHGAGVNALSVEELLAEFDRLRRSIVTVRHQDGSKETMTELRLRLEYDRVP